jgi:hypothetical protein
MTAEPRSIAAGLSNPWRFGAWDILWLQLLVAPAFLAPVYAEHHATHPYLELLAFLLAPTCYVAAMTAIARRRDHRRTSVVFTKVRQGVLYGVVFGLLSIIPAVVYEGAPDLLVQLELLGSINQAKVAGNRGVFYWLLISTFAPFVLVPLFVLLHYALVGAATGGVCGLLQDRWLEGARRIAVGRTGY